MSAAWDRARAVADAVLYEGYLLYPYRSTSSKNRSRWQFGVLGPSGAEESGIGENAALAVQVLIEPHGAASVSGVVRFLQLQRRDVEQALPDGRFEPVEELRAGHNLWVTWDEAVEQQVDIGPIDVTALPRVLDVSVPGGTDVEAVAGGRLLRRRRALQATLAISAERDGTFLRLSLELRNTSPPAGGKNEAVALSLIGTHLLLETTGTFVSLLEPSDAAADAVQRCRHHRCFPVLAGPPGDRSLMLVSPIILYDHPEIAEQSKGDLFDATEIDEILTLRVMTMTDEEKAQARATDALAARIIDRCDSMPPEAMRDMHGVLRNAHSGESQPALIPEVPAGIDWWSPPTDTAVHPESDAVLVNGARVARGSRVRLHPVRRADAQDLFYANRTARVASVHEDVDGGRHIAVVLDDDPAADIHEWYGRYLYFAPDEVEPVAERSAQWR